MPFTDHTNRTMPEGHKPKDWSCATTDDGHAVLFAMCVCGDDGCSWTGSSSPTFIRHQE